MWRQVADLDEVGKASGPEFWARVRMLGDWPYYPMTCHRPEPGEPDNDEVNCHEVAYIGPTQRLPSTSLPWNRTDRTSQKWPETAYLQGIAICPVPRKHGTSVLNQKSVISCRRS